MNDEQELQQQNENTTILTAFTILQLTNYNNYVTRLFTQ